MCLKKFALLQLYLLICFVNSVHSQQKFQQGYYIDNEGNRIEGLIKNVVWKNNPKSFDFKKDNDSEIENVSISNAREFKVDQLLYRRFEVKIDKSVDIVSQLDNNKNPVFDKEVLFLRLLVNGNAELYSYINRNVRRYFYYTEGLGAQQLVYKRYLTSDGHIAENSFFRSQLFENLKCSSITIDDIDDLNYSEARLINLFKKYNSCLDSNYEYVRSVKTNPLNVFIRAGLNFQTLYLENRLAPDNVNTDFDGTTNFIFGFGIEYVLPFHDFGWALILEPSYIRYISEGDLNGTMVTADYKAIDLPLGIRRYFEAGPKSRFHLGVSYVLTNQISSKIFGNNFGLVVVDPSSNAQLSLGYLQSRVGVELKYGFNRDLLTDERNWASDLDMFSLQLFFKLK